VVLSSSETRRSDESRHFGAVQGPGPHSSLIFALSVGTTVVLVAGTGNRRSRVSKKEAGQPVPARAVLIASAGLVAVLIMLSLIAVGLAAGIK
jgi:hypothetical protein